MKLKSLTIEGMASPLESPTLDDVERTLRAMNGTSLTLFTLDIDGDHHMAIGGGAERYIVVTTKDNQRFKSLTDCSSAKDKVLVVCGGQEGDFARNRCVNIDLARRAAIAFAETGEPAPDLCWEDD